jgi:hypothetical protein
MPKGPLGFPRLTNIGPFVTKSIDEWVLHPDIYHFVWEEVQSTDLIHFGQDPEILIEHDNSSLDNELMQEQLFIRKRDKQYKSKWLYDKVPTRFSRQSNEVHVGKTYDPSERGDLELFPEAVKFVSELRTKHGAMITFDFEQEWGEPVTGFMRAPVTNSMLSQSKKAVDGLPNAEFFELQSRVESGEFSTVDLKQPQTFQHPHYRSTGIKTREEMKKMFEVLIELSKEYERNR